MRTLDESAAREILNASRLGVLALNADKLSYAIPLFFGTQDDAVYFHCHPGLKDMWIDSTEEACLVVLHVESEDIWESVQVFGPLDRLSLNTDIQAAKNALYKVPFPPAEGNLPKGRPLRTEKDVYYLRLRIARIEGKGSTFEE